MACRGGCLYQPSTFYRWRSSSRLPPQNSPRRLSLPASTFYRSRSHFSPFAPQLAAAFVSTSPSLFIVRAAAPTCRLTTPCGGDPFRLFSAGVPANGRLFRPALPFPGRNTGFCPVFRPGSCYCRFPWPGRYSGLWPAFRPACLPLRALFGRNSGFRLLLRPRLRYCWPFALAGILVFGRLSGQLACPTGPFWPELWFSPGIPAGLSSPPKLWPLAGIPAFGLLLWPVLLYLAFLRPECWFLACCSGQVFFRHRRLIKGPSIRQWLVGPFLYSFFCFFLCCFF